MHSPDTFCFVCRKFITTRARKHPALASAEMCEAYNSCFSMPVGNQDRTWAPHLTYDYCKKTLVGKSC